MLHQQARLVGSRKPKSPSQALWAWKAELHLCLAYCSVLAKEDLSDRWKIKGCLLYARNTSGVSLCDASQAWDGKRTHNVALPWIWNEPLYINSYGELCFSNHPQTTPSIQTRTRTPVIDVQMDVVPKVSLNLGQTSVQDRDQWLPWPVTKPGRQEGKAAKLQLGLTTISGHRCAQIYTQTDNNGVCLFGFGYFFPDSRKQFQSLCHR